MPSRPAQDKKLTTAKAIGFPGDYRAQRNIPSVDTEISGLIRTRKTPLERMRNQGGFLWLAASGDKLYANRSWRSKAGNLSAMITITKGRYDQNDFAIRKDAA